MTHWPHLSPFELQNKMHNQRPLPEQKPITFHIDERVRSDFDPGSMPPCAGMVEGEQSSQKNTRHRRQPMPYCRQLVM